MKSELRLEVGIRVAADAVMLIAALWSALFITVGPALGLRDIELLILRDTPILLLIAYPLFFKMGVYGRARTYRLRFKAFSLLQATTLGFAILYGVDTILGAPRLGFQRVLIAWFITSFFTIGARVWSATWKWLWIREDRATATPGRLSLSRDVLLIGGAGYIGSALLPKLLSAGYRVRLLDSFVYGRDPITRYLDHPDLEVIHADFRQVDRVVEAMQDVGAVIHLGAIVGDPACALNEELTIEVNLIATKMIAEVAKAQRVSRFIFASTCSVYGASEQVLDERSALNPVSLYARSKIACEKVLLSLHSNNFHPVILRFGTVYGLSGRTRLDLVVNLLTAKAVLDGVITVFGSSQWRPFLHVDDAASAVMAALEAPAERLQQRIFNVGCDEQNYTLGQVGEMIREAVPTSTLQFTDDDAADVRNYRVSFGRIRQVLGFQPARTIKGGIAEVLDAIGTGRIKDYRDPRFSNVKFLSEEVGRNRLVVQNGWAKELVEAWDKETSTRAAGSA